MSDILLIMCVLYVFKALLSTSLMPGKIAWIAFGIVCAGSVWLGHGFALEQNKLRLEEFLGGQKILTDVSLVVMADLLLTLGFCKSALNRSVGIRNNRLLRLAGYIPPLLMFPVLYYAQVNMFFEFVGTDFRLLTGIVSAAVLSLVIGGTAAVRKLLPDADLRIELAALVELLMCILAVFSTIFHPSALMYRHSSAVEWRMLAFSVGIFVTLLGAGYCWHFLRPKTKRIK